MAKYVKMDFGAGVHRESTEYAEDGKWYNASRVRFRSGKAENMRGYATKVTAAFDGKARDLITWQDNDQFKRAVWGTEKKLYEHNGDEIFDIRGISIGNTSKCIWNIHRNN
jgi:hypothetical protein